WAQPRDVGGAVPEMALKVATGEAAAAVVFVFDVHPDLGFGSLGLRVDRVRVGDDQILALRFEAVDLVGLPNQASPLGIPSGNRAEHDHAVAKAQLSVRDRAVRIGIDGVPLEAKS